MLTFPGNNAGEIDEGESAMLELEAVPHRTVDLPFRVNLASANGDTNDYGLDASPSSGQ